MNGRRDGPRFGIKLAFCGLVALVGWGCQPGGAGGGGPATDDPCLDVECLGNQECNPQTGQCESIDDEGELLQDAAERAREIDTGAILIQASGLNGPYRADTTTQTVEWQFTAVNPDAPQNTYFLGYDRSAWSVETVPSVLVGVSYYDLLQVTMTEAEARARLAEAGLPDDFFGWTLYKPIPASFPNALYAFNYADSTATVDTRTGEVASDVVEQLPDPGVGTNGVMGPDSVSLRRIAEASEEIGQIEPRAMIVRACGRSADGQPLAAPGETAIWNFRAVCCSEEEGIRSWTLTFDGDWTVSEDEVPPFGVEFLDLGNLDVDVVEAWDALIDAGYDPSFAWWSVCKPNNPEIENPRYVFPVETGFVLVDAVTGKVLEE
ncbi:MAG TPA: hypothetical protein VM487_20320 [Phycisphaerae bacterium]|nr:hypothetical protein [Phycisphaerae bacterium]